MAATEIETVDVDAVDVPLKTGFLTSEFWTTTGAILANVFVVLVALGRMTPEQASQINTALGQLVTTVPVVIANLLVLWRYVNSRTAVKQAAFQAATDRMSLRLQQRALQLKEIEAAASDVVVATALAKKQE